MPALMELDLRITEKQSEFINSEAFETLFGGAAPWAVVKVNLTGN
jgi:hypothetical protein